MSHCWKCGASLEQVPLPLSRYARCPACAADLYVCRQCRHFDPRYHNACREERAEVPRERDHANFCDWFLLNPDAYSGGGVVNAAARTELEALFGGAETESKPVANPLGELFKK